MKNPTVMQHNFATIEPAQVQRSSFDRSHGHKTTLDANDLVPFYLDECLPGDTFTMNAHILARMSTPIHPIMDNVYLDTFFFAVPLRILWNNFQKMMGEQIDPGDSIDFTIPQMVSTASTGYLAGSLYDHLGLPTEVPDLSHSTLPMRAYYKIWNDWFRDQNLQDSLTVPLDDGPDLPAEYTMQKRGKRHDYFTSCLPAPQRGAAISMSLGSTAPLIMTGGPTFEGATADFDYGALQVSTSGKAVTTLNTNPSTIENLDWKTTGLTVDLTNATAGTINALRLSIQLQVMLERDARGGTRFPEILKSHFGITSPDARLQRPEFLGGGSIPVKVAPVPQTGAGFTTAIRTADTVGSLGAFATAQGNNGFTKSFVEHSIIIGLISIRADLTYQRGLERQWSRLTRYDHYFPALAHLGEQGVLNKEIFAQGSLAGGADDALIFGYQERWAELRYKPSQITGTLRSNHAQSLDAWHLSQDFGSSLPVLNSAFITEAVPMARVQAVSSEPDFIFDSYLKLTCVRPLPIYSIPGFGAKL